MVMSLAFTASCLPLLSLLVPVSFKELVGLLGKETQETVGTKVGAEKKLEQEQGQEEEAETGFIEREGETMMVLLVGYIIGENG